MNKNSLSYFNSTIDRPTTTMATKATSASSDGDEVAQLRLHLKAKQKELDEVERAWKKSKGKMSKVLERFKSLQEQSKSRKISYGKSEKARKETEEKLLNAEATVAELRAGMLLEGSGENGDGTGDTRGRLKALEAELADAKADAAATAAELLKLRSEGQAAMGELKGKLDSSLAREQSLEQELEEEKDKNDSQEETVQEKTEEVEWLAEELEQTKGALKELREKQAASVEAGAGPELGSIEEKNEEIEWLTEELKQTKEALKETRESLHESEAAAQEATAEGQQSAADNSKLASLEESVKSLNEQLESAKEEAVENENIANSRGQLLAENAQQMVVSDRKIKALEEKCEQLESLTDSSDQDLILKLQDSQQTVNDLWKKCERAENALREKIEDYNAVNEDRSKLKKHLRDMANDREQDKHASAVSSAKKQVKEARTAKVFLEGKIDELSEQTAVLEAKVSELQSSNSVLSEEKLVAEEKAGESAERLSEALEQVSGLRSDLTTSEAEREETKLARNNFFASIANGKYSNYNELQRVFGELENRIEHAKKGQTEASQEVENLRATVTKLEIERTAGEEQNELEKIKEELEMALKLNQTLNETRSTLSPDLEVAKQEKLSLQEHVDLLQKSHASVKEELEDTKLLYEKALALNKELVSSNDQVNALKLEAKGAMERLESATRKHKAELGKIKELYKKSLMHNKELTASIKKSLIADAKIIQARVAASEAALKKEIEELKNALRLESAKHDASERQRSDASAETQALAECKKALAQKEEDATKAKEKLKKVVERFKILQDQAKEKKAVIEQMQKQMQDMPKATGSESESTGIEKERKKAKQSVERYKELQKRVKENKKTHAVQLDGLTKELAGAREAAKNMEQEVRALQLRCKKQMTDVSDAAETKAALVGERIRVASMMEKYQALEGKLDEVRTGFAAEVVKMCKQQKKENEFEEEMGELEERLSQKQKQVDALESAAEKHKSTVESQASDLEKAQTKMKKVVARFKELQNQLKTTREEHKSEVLALQTQLGESAEQKLEGVERLETELLELQKLRDDSEWEASDAKKEVGRLQEALENLKTLHEDTKHTHAEVMSKIGGHGPKDLGELENIFADMEEKVETLEQENFEANRQVSDLKSQNELYAQTENDLRGQLQTAQDRAKAALLEHGQTQAQLDELRKLYDAEQAERTADKGESSKLKEKMKTIVDRFKLLQTKHKAAKAESQTLKSALGEKEEQLLQLNQQVKDLQESGNSEQSELKASLDKLTAKLETATSEKETLQTEMGAARDDAASNVKKLEQKNTQLQEKLKRGNERYKKLQNQHREARGKMEAEIDNMKANAQAAESIMSEENAATAEKLKNSIAEATSKEESIRAETARANQLKVELEKCRKELGGHETNLGAIQAEMDALRGEQENAVAEKENHITYLEKALKEANDKLAIYEDEAILKLQNSRSGKVASARKKTTQETKEAFAAMQQCLQGQLSTLSNMLETPSLDYFEESKAQEQKKEKKEELVHRFRHLLNTISALLQGPIGTTKQGELVVEVKRAFLLAREEIVRTAQMLNVDVALMLPDSQIARRETLSTIAALEQRNRELHDDLRRADSHEVLVLKEAAQAQANMRNEYEAEIARLHQSVSGELSKSADWTRMNDTNTGNQYYVNRNTGQTQWEIPSELLVNVDQGERKVLREENEALSKTVKQLENELSGARQDYSSSSGVINDLEQKLSRLRNDALRSKGLENDLETIQFQLHVTESKLKDAEGAAADLQLKVGGLQSEIGRLTAEVDQQEIKNAVAVKNAAMEARNFALQEMQDDGEVSKKMAAELKKLELECEKLSEEKVIALETAESKHAMVLDQLRTKHVLEVQDLKAQAASDMERSMRQASSNAANANIAERSAPGTDHPKPSDRQPLETPKEGKRSVPLETPRPVEIHASSALQPAESLINDVTLQDPDDSLAASSFASSIGFQSRVSVTMTPKIARERARQLAAKLADSMKKRKKTRSRKGIRSRGLR